MNIRVTFEDMSCGGGAYAFAKPTAGFDEWTVIPRVGDHILDLNEFKYRVETVTWYDSGSVRMQIKREQ